MPLRSAPPAPAVVLLDLDDTLYAERDWLLSGCRAVAGCAEALLGRSAAELYGWLLQRLLTEGRERLFDALLAAHGRCDPALSALLVHVFRSHRPRLTAFADVAPALAAWRARGCGLGLITDGVSCAQHAKLDGLGLRAGFDLVLCTDDLPGAARKPAPLAFQLALAHFGCAPEQAVYIGDDPSKDFLAPRALGMRTLRIDRHLPWPLQSRRDFPDSHQAHRTIESLAEAAAPDASGLAA